MFTGQLFSRFAGVSKKSDKPFYSVGILVKDSEGQIVPFKSFVSKEIYTKIEKLPINSVVSVRSGVNGFGNLCVTDIIPSEK